MQNVNQKRGRVWILEIIIKSSSTGNGLVADFFCGTGTTAAIAERLGRKCITTDLSKTAIQVTRSRLVNQRVRFFN
ncbi:MAG: DNA methyltransferase [Thermoplasmataceae archaeon]